MLFCGRFEGKPWKSRWVDVYDVAAKRFLATLAPSEQPAATGGPLTDAADPLRSRLAPSGGAVLSFGSIRIEAGQAMSQWAACDAGALREVGKGRVLWRAGTSETLVEGVDDRFLVRERWHESWKRWLPRLQYESFAHRSMETGKLLCRTPVGAGCVTRRCNASRTLAVLDDGAVHPYPPRVNWLLLALCQSILALPLVLLWAILKWRRCRRLAEAAP